MCYKILSYHISPDSPAWPTAQAPFIEQQVFVSKGDPCNEWNYMLRNHVGTHFDAPNHHLENGIKIADLPLSKFIYEKPLIVDIPKGYSEKITKANLLPYKEQIAKCDLLMLRTGFYKVHEDNPVLYGSKSPAVSSEAAEYIVKTFDNVKAVMLDFISLGTYNDITDGNIAHRWLLGKWTENYVCIIEDVNLGGISNDTLKRVFALPLFVKDIDSAQVTVLAEIDD